jgi:hypothetical protein
MPERQPKALFASSPHFGPTDAKPHGRWVTQHHHYHHHPPITATTTTAISSIIFIISIISTNHITTTIIAPPPPPRLDRNVKLPCTPRALGVNRS